MDKKIDFFQIYYHEDQLSEIYDFATPYRNDHLTPFFENSVIAHLAPKSTADYLSICSWRLRRKRGEGSPMLALKGNTSLTLEKIINADFDVAILTPRSPNHKPLAMAVNWHGKAWTQAFDALLPFFNSVGIRIRGELKHTIYENHFIARGDIYRDYVERFLRPCISFMEGNEVFMADAGYARRKTAEERKRYHEITGRTDWPIAPFVLERMFSVFINDKNFNIINL